MWTEGCPYRAALEEWLKLKNISLPITSITSYATIIGCVSAGSGVSLVPKSLLSNIKNLTNIRGYKFEHLAFMQNQFFGTKM